MTLWSVDHNRIVNERGEVVCVMGIQGLGGAPPDEQEKNKLTIAAAPTAIAALQKIGAMLMSGELIASPDRGKSLGESLKTFSYALNETLVALAAAGINTEDLLNDRAGQPQPQQPGRF